jgi:hypothetical protein
MDRPDPEHQHAPVLPLRPPPAGGPDARGAVIVSIADLGGRRVSTIRRGDGTTFTVTIPAGGIDTQQESGRSVPWILEHGGVPRTPVALDGLAARVGMHLVPVPPSGPPGS